MTKFEERMYDEFAGMSIDERANYVADCMTADELEALSFAILEKSIALRKYAKRQELKREPDYVN